MRVNEIEGALAMAMAMAMMLSSYFDRYLSISSDADKRMPGKDLALALAESFVALAVFVAVPVDVLVAVALESLSSKKPPALTGEVNWRFFR